VRHPFPPPFPLARLPAPFFSAPLSFLRCLAWRVVGERIDEREGSLFFLFLPPPSHWSAPRVLGFLFLVRGSERVVVSTARPFSPFLPPSALFFFSWGRQPNLFSFLLVALQGARFFLFVGDLGDTCPISIFLFPHGRFLSGPTSRKKMTKTLFFFYVLQESFILFLLSFFNRKKGEE